MFQDVTNGTLTDRFGSVSHIFVHRQKNEFRFAVLFLKQVHCVKTVERWHGDIGNDHIGFQLGRLFDQGSSVIGNSDQFVFRFEDGPQSVGNDPVIIGDQYFDTIHKATQDVVRESVDSGIGTTTAMDTPCEGAV
ncbi:MAG: hypothetical protein RLZZ396_3179 [Planctomycetota bacterium]